MAKRRPVIRDPVLGDLRWLSDTVEWDRRIRFTPKHEISIYVNAPSSLWRNTRPDLALAAARAAYLSVREREWDHRLHAAAKLIEFGIGGHEGAAGLARRLRLRSVQLDLG